MNPRICTCTLRTSRRLAVLATCIWAVLLWAAPALAEDRDDQDTGPVLLEMADPSQELDDDERRTIRQAQQRELMELSCRDELDRPESWMDRTHSYLSQRLCEPAAWFDGFFGDPRSFEETPVGSFIRIRNSLRWDQSEDFNYRLRVRANLSLPRVSERVRLIITRDEDVAGEFDETRALDAEEDRTRIGLRFLASDRAQSRFDVDGTVRVSGTALNPRLRGRYRYTQGLTDHSLARLTQTVFWERDDGFGTTSRADYEWLPDRDQLYRLTGQGTWSEASSGIDWRTSAVAFRQLTTRTALRGEIGAFGFTSPSVEAEEFFVAVRYRRQFLRRWLFYELQPEHAWPKDFETGNRRSDWRFTFTVEVQFENQRSRDERLRRYAGDEVDPKEFEFESIPIEAPGEAALDHPVLNDDRDDEPEEQEDEDEGEGEDGGEG